MLTKNIFLLLGLYIIFAYQANANSQVWHGNILTTEEVPKTAFIFSDIYRTADNDFEEVINSQEIETVVLISRGGYVDKGCTSPTIFNQRSQPTFRVKSMENRKLCFRCTFIFFAGNPRLAKGTVAVHRFATDFEAFLIAEFEEKI